MPKINEEHMAELFSGFGMRSQAPTSSVTEHPQNVSANVDNSPTSQQGNKVSGNITNTQKSKRKPKADRISFMCRLSEANLLKIRILSATSGRSLSDFIDMSVSAFLEDYESKNGNILSRT